MKLLGRGPQVIVRDIDDPVARYNFSVWHASDGVADIDRLPRHGSARAAGRSVPLVDAEVRALVESLNIYAVGRD